jgi:hypothetical protein
VDGSGERIGVDHGGSRGRGRGGAGASEKTGGEMNFAGAKHIDWQWRSRR